MVKVVPIFFFDSMSIEPFKFSTIFLMCESPIPVDGSPVCLSNLVVNPGLKIYGRISSSIPSPSSEILSIIFSESCS